MDWDACSRPYGAARSDLFWVDHLKTFVSRDFTERLVGYHRVVYEPSAPQFHSDCKLKGVKSAKPEVECVTLQQELGQGKLRFSDRKNFQLARGDILA